MFCALRTALRAAYRGPTKGLSPARRLLAPFLIASLPFAIACCSHSWTGIGGADATSPAPGVPWTAPPRILPDREPAAGPDIPAALSAPEAVWTLGDAVDIALRNSPRTREAWLAARAAAAEYGSSKGDYLPDLDLHADFTRRRQVGLSGSDPITLRTYGASLNLSWLIFDFGGREASVAESRYALIAADFEHSAAIQELILDVERAYFEHAAANALLAAQQASVEEAQAGLDAADARHAAGLATIADVLQARTALSQARLAFEQAQGTLAAARGRLATAMGLSVNAALPIAPEDDEHFAEADLEEVAAYLRSAEAIRPDLAAARARAEQIHANVGVVKARGRPQIRAEGSAGRLYVDSSDDEQDTYTATLQFDLPLFTGFSQHYDVRRAEALAEAERARLAALEQDAALQVWTSYHDAQTARQRLRTSEDLLESATENQQVAAGRYQAGVGTILDLVTAQAALQEARATVVQARADWRIALAELAYSGGTLTLPPRSPGPSTNAPSQGGADQ